jgi:Protein of unknown function (DUF4240)
MNDKEFWDLIAWANARHYYREEREEAIEDALSELPPEEIEDFFLVYDRHVTQAWTNDVALLAHLINRYGDRSDHLDLRDFVCWLIDQGKAAYQAALTDPDRLADLADDQPWESEGYWDRAAYAWANKTEQDQALFYARVGKRGASEGQEYPGGGVVDPDDLRRRWPRLCNRFIDE